MFIKIKEDEFSCDEVVINTDQIILINVKELRIKFIDGSSLFVPKSELDKVLMAITENIVMRKEPSDESRINQLVQATQKVKNERIFYG